MNTLMLRDLILRNLPEDGSTVGNHALLALLREQVPELTDEWYNNVKEVACPHRVVRFQS